MRFSSPQLTHVFQGFHPHWTSDVHIYSDGSFRRICGDGGRCDLEHRTRIKLIWAAWPAEELYWNPKSHCYENADGKFRLVSQMQEADSVEDSHSLIIGIPASTHAAFLNRRKRCLETWGAPLKQLGIEILFLVGTGGQNEVTRIATPEEHGRVGDELLLPCKNDYQSFPSKIALFLDWALENREFKRSFICHDDTYVVPARLLAVDASECDLVGRLEDSRRGRLLAGGAGFFLNRSGAPAASKVLMGREFYDEGVLYELLLHGGLRLKNEPRMISWADMEIRPRPENQLISGHGFDSMFELHKQTWEEYSELFAPKAEMCE